MEIEPLVSILDSVSPQLRSFSWGMLSSAIAMLNAFSPYLEHHLIGHLIVALVVSALSCLMLVSLDKVVDRDGRTTGATKGPSWGKNLRVESYEA